MSTAYQAPLAAYESHAMHGYPLPHTQVGRTKTAMADNAKAQIYRPSTQQPHLSQHPLSSNWRSRQTTFSGAPTLVSNSQTISRPPSPSSTATLALPQTSQPSKKGSETLIYHSLEIPQCISPNGGNLADFAAQMTCLFWFESADELKQAETIRSRPPTAPIIRLPALARPHDQFRKWVLSILSTTQVTQNVILLALLFIYRLKMASPQVKGRAGSEYRLLVVALMLGNKFLDDNTYTNKTWAEVSSFAVKEIHVMEVEFLSNMRYNLLASKQEWDAWLEKLGCFHDYYERALRLPMSPIHMPSPMNNMINSPMVSPTNTSAPALPEMGPTTPTITTNLSPTSGRSQNWPAYQANALSPLAAKPTMNLGPTRKRSCEEDQADHPAKRFVPLSRIPPSAVTPMGPQSQPNQQPAPPLTLATNQQPQSLPQPAPYSQGSYAQGVGAPAASQVSLPPLQPGMRAMSTVYQQGPVSIPPQQSVATSTPAPALHQPGLAATLPSHAPMGYGNGAKNRSPGSLAPFAASPMPDQFGAGSGYHTPISNSPSFYLQQRNSPYRPIRHVNTLLYPPPSASLDQYHLSVPIQPTQMHYQPLGRRHDVRTGVVPEFMVFNRTQPPQLQSQGAPQGHYPA